MLKRRHDLPGFRGDTIRLDACGVGVGDFVVTRYAGQDRLAFVCKITPKGGVYVRLYLDLSRSWGPAFQICDHRGRLDVVIQDGAELPPRPRIWQAVAARRAALEPGVAAHA